jgi:hypothetical protein
MSPMPAVTGPRTAHTFTAAPVSVSSISPSPEPTHSASSTTLAPQTTPGIEGFDGSDLLDGTPLDDATPKPAPEWTEWGDGYDY